ncbi:acyl-CoA thioester hydrolase/BAAT C-terminal domain-containing protein [Pontibacter ruber]|uniref:Acyl-CoA thioester hydrolase/BAAT C-terminal domain-containing protein n=1 Tax=Pontibacter ruber TaxID=1343895 RepID=A0ABW5D2P4_9BACT|nr:acyl-CoA thioester hydrolase/BAAT C-terminal domain-containing protein [Pontibacter ruber]
MKHLLLLLLPLLLYLPTKAQIKKPEEFGYRHLQTRYKQDTVDILVMSKKGEEQQVKPIFLFIQGSLPTPLIILKENGEPYKIFPFDADLLLDDYHLAIVSKPFIPVIREESSLRPNMSYVEVHSGTFPENYVLRDNLDYYTYRNKAVVKYLVKQPWVCDKKIVVAGHSEGAAIAAKLAQVSKDITHLIFASTNPFGRMATIVSQIRQRDDTAGTAVKRQLTFWKEVVEDPANNEVKGEITFKSLYSFSKPPVAALQKLKMPVMVSYGTKDIAAPFYDYFHIEAIRAKKKNFTFMPYVGREHNFFGFDENGKVNYEDFGWDKVALDWKKWLERN